MALKVKRTGSEEYGRYVKALVCGEPGTGKTLTASTWPNVLYVNAEGGLMSVADRNVPAVDVTDSAMLLELKNVLMQPPEIHEKELGVRVETVCLDTIDEIGRLLQKERLEATGKDAMVIQDWSWYGDQMRALIRAYRNLPMNVIFNCHLKAQTDEETGKMFVKPAIQGATGDEIAGFVDLAVVLIARPHTEVVDNKQVRTIVRHMQTFPDSRSPWIKDRSGKLPMELPVNFHDDHKRVDAFIFGSSEPLPPTQPVAEVDSSDVVGEAERVVASSKPDEQPQRKKAAKPKKAEKPKVDDTAQASEPEPSVPQEAETDLQPEPEVEAQAAEPEPAAEVIDVREDPSSESVSESETAPSTDNALVCSECQNAVESKDQADLSFIRFRRRLCRSCMKEARARK